MWECPKCHNHHSDDWINICWSCNTDRRNYVGTIDCDKSEININYDNEDSSDKDNMDTWACLHCKVEVDEEMEICWNCGFDKQGKILSSEQGDSFHKAKEEVLGPKQGTGLLFTIIGAIIGSIIGYILRPSIPLIGKLPFEAVITRGTSLKGFDQLLISVAQDSFNYLIIGLVGGGLLGYYKDRSKVKINDNHERNHTESFNYQDQKTISDVQVVDIGHTIDEVESVLGRPHKIATIKTKTIYVYKDMKITFEQGKVVDVE